MKRCDNCQHWFRRLDKHSLGFCDEGMGRELRYDTPAETCKKWELAKLLNGLPGESKGKVRVTRPEQDTLFDMSKLEKAG